VKNIFVFNIGEQFLLKPGRPVKEIGTIGGIISTLLKNIYVLAGVLLFVLLIVGGFIFIIGAGQDNPEQAKKGKQALTAALLGFVIIFISYWIIRIIEILTGIKIFNPTF